MGVVVWRDDERGTAVKENGDSGWSSVGVMRHNRDTVEWWGE
jgi:hypothetical protein